MKLCSRLLTCLPILLLLPIACYHIKETEGGGQTKWQPPRHYDPSDIATIDGYAIELLATGFTFPTSITFDPDGNAYVAEAGYSYGEVFTTPRIIRVDPSGQKSVLFQGENNGPWTGVFYYNGYLYITEGGELEGGRILRLSLDGREVTVLIEDLPTLGDHHTNSAVVGPDSFLYVGLGTATNSAVVGPDNYRFGWLKRYPDFHDIPCRDITLAGRNFVSDNPFTSDDDDQATTGAFVPFGTPTTEGQLIRGQIPCSGAILRLPLDTGMPQLVAWGFRNPFGLAFDADGNLYVTENAYDDRGSRPVWGTGDVLWRVEQGAWYGWPDYTAGEPLTHGEHSPPGADSLTFLLDPHPGRPPKPIAVLGVHSSSNGLDISRNDSFGYPGHIFIAQFGDQVPTTGKLLSPVGYRVVRVDPARGVITDFVTNIGATNGPASRLETGGLERPVSIRFSPDGSAMYIVDFGVLLMREEGSFPQPETGAVWKVTRTARSTEP